MQIPFSPPHITDDDIAAVVEVLRSGWITSGPVMREFETALAEYCGVDSLVALNSCTAALQTAVDLLDIGPGDDVVVPAYTYTASASVVHKAGANLVFVDNEEGEYTPSIEGVISAITPNTKAIIVVDLGGVPYDTRELIQRLPDSRFNTENGILKMLGRPAVIVDAAHSLGAVRDEKRSGQLGDFTTFSFHAVKNLTTAEGGALCWRSDLPVPGIDLETIVRTRNLHGQTKDALSKARAGSWEYDIVECGNKANMPDVLAALGLSQLRRYDEIVSCRQTLVASYTSFLSEIGTPLQHKGTQFESSAHLYLLRLECSEEERNKVIFAMANDGIATNVHYKPLPMLTAYRSLGFHPSDFPNAMDQYEKTISLPLHTKLTESNVETIARSLKNAVSLI